MKILGYFNLLGVIALAVLCGFQWEANRRANLREVALDKIRQEQTQKIAEQDRTIKGYIADLDDFRHRLERTEAALKQIENQLATVSGERDRAAAARDQAVAERDQLLTEREKFKETLAKWMAAVGERDEALKKASSEVQALGKDRNEAVMKFNDLAVKYNGLVKDLNEARAKLAGGR
jgi:septal ring factor EnvC (AmiA/AmiB activator)